MAWAGWHGEPARMVAGGKCSSLATLASWYGIHEGAMTGKLVVVIDVVIQLALRSRVLQRIVRLVWSKRLWCHPFLDRFLHPFMTTGSESQQGMGRCCDFGRVGLFLCIYPYLTGNQSRWSKTIGTIESVGLSLVWMELLSALC